MSMQRVKRDLPLEDKVKCLINPEFCGCVANLQCVHCVLRELDQGLTQTQELLNKELRTPKE